MRFHLVSALGLALLAATGCTTTGEQASVAATQGPVVSPVQQAALTVEAPASTAPAPASSATSWCGTHRWDWYSNLHIAYKGDTTVTLTNCGADGLPKAGTVTSSGHSHAAGTRPIEIISADDTKLVAVARSSSGEIYTTTLRRDASGKVVSGITEADGVRGKTSTTLENFRFTPAAVASAR